MWGPRSLMDRVLGFGPSGGGSNPSGDTFSSVNLADMVHYMKLQQSCSKHIDRGGISYGGPAFIFQEPPT